MISDWLLENWIEIFGAVTGIIYVFLEIRQNPLLWPVGFVTSAVYVWVFFMGKLYADMSLQGYYLVISVIGWYWWVRGSGRRAEGLAVTRLKIRTGLILSAVFVTLFVGIWLILSRLTDSPVPGWDSFITSLSIVATWMLARKIYEHWYLWIAVNTASILLFISRGLYPTMALYIVYLIMSFAGLKAWKRSL
jgi:nicotinamide mononucleotide transporter